MTWINLLMIINLLIPQPNSAAQDQLKVKEIKKECKSITTDRLGNLYLINDYRLTMYNKAGDSLREFNSRKFGNITYVDATDPYQILVFFQDYNLIVFLDNFLSQNGDPIDLQELGYDQISFACQSREKGVWIFDPLRQKLIKLNNDFQVTHESLNLAQWFGKNIQPNFMVEFNNQLFISQENDGFFVFDHFGTFLKRIQLKDAQKPQIMEGKINFLKQGVFCQYNLNSFETICDTLDNNSVSDIRIEQGRTYIKNDESVSIYRAN